MLKIHLYLIVVCALISYQGILFFCMNYHNLFICLGFPGGSDSKASACNAGDQGSIPGSGRSLEKEMATHSSTHGWKSLVGYSPWGCKESDTTKQFHLVHAVLGTGLHSYRWRKKNFNIRKYFSR